MSWWQKLKFDYFKHVLGVKPEPPQPKPTAFTPIFRNSDELGKLFLEFTMKAENPDRDEAELNRLILEAKMLDATFAYKVAEDGGVETTMMYNVTIDDVDATLEKSMYFKKE